MTEGKCKFCQRKIVWAKMPSGKLNPFVKVTAYTISQDEDAEKVIPQDEEYGQLFISHFVDCQDIAGLRKDHAHDEAPT